MEIEGLSELISSFEGSISNYNAECKRTINRIGNKLLRKVKLKSPVDTGQLRRTWQYVQKSNDEGIVSCNLHYVNFVEYGHRTRNGGFVEGRYMLTKSVDEVQNDLDKDLEIMIDNLFE